MPPNDSRHSQRTRIDGKVVDEFQAVRDIHTGTSLAVGGYGMSAFPSAVIDALSQTDATALQIVFHNCGTDRRTLGLMLEQGRIARVVVSYVGHNQESARRHSTSELDGKARSPRDPHREIAVRGSGDPGFALVRVV